MKGGFGVGFFEWKDCKKNVLYKCTSKHTNVVFLPPSHMPSLDALTCHHLRLSPKARCSGISGHQIVEG